jgi:hypothetical protein
MRLFLWSHHPLIEIRNRDDSSLTRATARAPATFGSCASDHFLNPLVGLFIEISIGGILF